VLGAVVAAQHGRIAPVDGEAVEFVDQVSSGGVALDQPPRHSRVFIHHGHDLDWSAVGNRGRCRRHAAKSVRLMRE
jgi:hypothetical protein